jgi:hypothetical protein
MSSFPQIPYDVIETIVERLRNDKATLKNCSLVSHSFLLLSRRWLFSVILLDTSLASQRLYHLLKVNPTIAPMIRELFIKIDSYPGSTGVMHDRYLPTTLGLVSSLHLLSLHCTYKLTWQDLSTELCSAIVPHFESLAAVKFSSLRLPISAVTNFTKLRSLSLLDIDFDDDGSLVPLPMLAQLEALELGITDEYHLPVQVVTRMASQMQNLKLLSVSISFGGALPPALEVIRSSARSIETIVWSCQMCNAKRKFVFSTPGVLNFNAQLLQLSTPSHSLAFFKIFDPWS